MDRQQDIFCINNVTARTQQVALENINLVSTTVWRDLLTGDALAPGQAQLELAPYQCAWLTNAPDTA